MFLLLVMALQVISRIPSPALEPRLEGRVVVRVRGFNWVDYVTPRYRLESTSKHSTSATASLSS